MMFENIKVIDDGILFKFVENIAHKTFENKTASGLIIKDRDNDVKHPRWVKILVIGPKVTKLKVGDYALVDSLMWTNALEYGGDKFWKTNERMILMRSEELPREFI